MTQREKELDRIAKLLVRRDLALTEANERLIAMDKAKSEFIVIAAHQLRTPLSGVKWTLKMMIDGDLGSLTEEQKEFLKRGYQTNERMIQLVNDLLNVARIEEGRLVYTVQEFYLEDLIEEIIKGFARNIKKKHLDLKFTKPEKQLPKIKADSEKIRLALENLLDNAILYTANYGKIRINVEQENNQLKTSVEDSGMGIPKEQQVRVFSKFFRGSNVMRTAVEGTGLGLYIVKNIIKAHGGEIGLESTENHGSTFWFSLPL